MTKEVIMGLVRHALTFGGGILVSFGFVDDIASWESISGALATVIGGVWSIWQKVKAGS